MDKDDIQIDGAMLAYRRVGDETWTAIDPESTVGKAFAARLGFTTTPQKERVDMTAIPVTQTHIRAVPTPDPQSLGLLATMQDKASAAWAWITSMPERAMGWAKRIVPDSVTSRVATAWGWTKAKAAAVFRMLGKTGNIGAAMLLVSTVDGRRLLSLVAKPFIWAGKTLANGWVTLETLLFVDKPRGVEPNVLDKVRNFISERMADVRTALFGSGTQENRYGFLGNIAIKTFLKVGPYLTLDSKTMLTTRGIGALLFGSKLFVLAPLLPVAGWIVFIAQAFVVMGTFIGAGEPLLQVAEQVTGVKANATKKEATEASKVAATVTDIPVKSAPAPHANSNRRPSGKPSARTR